MLQVEIVTASDGGSFQRNLNTVLRRLSNIASLAIKGGPPGGYVAIVTYHKDDEEGVEEK